MQTFDDWLGQLAAAGKGPHTLYATRGRPWVYKLALEGNWTGATLRGEIRLFPDAPGDHLLEFIEEGPVVAGGFSTFTIAISAETISLLPPAPAGDGFIVLAYDLLLTPSGGLEDLLLGGPFNLIGRITV